MAHDLGNVDFALHELPGDELHAVLRGYRERGPISPTHFLGLPAYVISAHAPLLEAFTDSERFPPERMYQVSFESAVGRSFISMPDPEHRVFRKLATPAFRSRAIERFERESLAALAHELLDDVESKDEFDLIADYAARLPYLVITRLLGLPREREEEFQQWALALLRFRDDPVAGAKASEELTRFLAPVVAERRREPRSDVISELVQARVEGRGLSDEEVSSHVRLLFPTGGETTHGSLGNMLWALLSQDGAWDTLRRDPARAHDAVSETLRWETSIAVLPRLSPADRVVEFHGVELPPGSWVMFAIAGANRDPAIFSEPDRFDLDRNAPDTLTFGRGVKSCPGMHLARKNMRVALQVLLERTPALELLDAEAAVPRRSVLRCPDALRVRRTR